ncbi:hypothetical protein FIV00_03555 [Labrenzia sp. THAF82]|uniref:YfbU family protein n=1 Tax=Labrenzia sp. THAF82 TaxID=2587861 RepID=UPI00126828A1|nr:YfbU family protein [Labrenzia sp. THAF82]QFT29545.1 hypothetical protein FIV00_03555 [Labrenzia sp. THAF82]
MAKTERFEMRLDSELLNRVDHWRGDQDDAPSRAEAVRRLLEVALTRSDKDEELRLNKPNRLIVWMLSELLKNLPDYENQDTVKLIQKALYGGHFWALDWELTGVLHSHTDSRQALKLVVDTLDMWVFIERAYAAFSKADRERLEKVVPYRGKDPKFIGFDGNNETEYMGIAQFLVDEMERFQDFKGRSMNSHSPKVGVYYRMVRQFEPIRANLVGREMTVDEIADVLNADK